tara:strand:- start:41 stop:541 length:501 start_codon:yes stop_codon:yes gene_type:complete
MNVDNCVEEETQLQSHVMQHISYLEYLLYALRQPGGLDVYVNVVEGEPMQQVCSLLQQAGLLTSVSLAEIESNILRRLFELEHVLQQCNLLLTLYGHVKRNDFEQFRVVHFALAKITESDIAQRIFLDKEAQPIEHPTDLLKENIRQLRQTTYNRLRFLDQMSIPK